MGQLLNTVLILVFAMVVGVKAQTSFDPQDTVYASGAVFDTEEQLADIQRTRTFRAFLPASVDLSDRFPRVGNQGKQSSCTGWAVGYAARSYYNSAPEQGRRLSKNQIQARHLFTIPYAEEMIRVKLEPESARRLIF